MTDALMFRANLMHIAISTYCEVGKSTATSSLNDAQSTTPNRKRSARFLLVVWPQQNQAGTHRKRTDYAEQTEKRKTHIHDNLLG